MLESTFGPYRIEELLGRGGMGEVYRAHDTETDRRVALKVLPGHLAEDAEYQERFRRECRAAARLREPHIVPIHRFGEIDGQLYLDMRLVEGTDLAAWLRRHGPMPAEAAVTVVSQIAAALDAAHAEGLVHRDVKPSNVLLAGVHDADVDANVFAYLFDFGIARAQEGSGEDPALTRAGTMPGSLAYIAPERFAGVEGDPRADVYSLACVLYQALTGHPPYEGDLATLMHAHLNAPPPKPSATLPDLPTGLDEVVAQGMAKEPEQRVASAGALAAAARAELGSWRTDANASTSAFAAQRPSLLKPAAAQGSAQGLAQPPSWPGPGHAGGQHPSNPQQPSNQYPGNQYPGGPQFPSNPQQPSWGAQPSGWTPQQAYGPSYPSYPSHPSYPPQQQPPRRSRVGVIAAAVVAVVALVGGGIVAAVLLGGDGGGGGGGTSTTVAAPPTTTTTAPPTTSTAPTTPEVSELLVDLPAGYNAANCRPDSLGGSTAFVACDGGPSSGTGPTSAAFARYASTAEMDAAFDGYTQAESITAVGDIANCRANASSRGRFSRPDDSPGGQVACFTDAESGASYLFWTDERATALGYIASGSGNAVALYDWWLSVDFSRT